MHREDNSKYVLYIEPKKEDKLSEPINDELTQIKITSSFFLFYPIILYV